MLVTRQPVLRRFWYPVVPLSALDDGPQAFTLLGEKIVLWRDGDGAPVALEDRCCHRTTQLSKGWVEDGCIVCGYHGWTYDRTGKCVRIPQRREPESRSGFRVRSFRTAERYGYVWVALDEPLADVPEFPEAADPDYRKIDQFYEVWHCAGLRLMENSFDNAHVHFVHRKTFGVIKEPVPPKLTIEENDQGFVMRADLKVFNSELQKKNLKDDAEFTTRHVTSTWYKPFARKLHIRYPNGLVHAIVTVATPIDDASSQIVQFAFRNDSEAEAPAADIVAFDRQVTAEDRDILESTEYDVPLDPQSGYEFHMVSDKPGLVMRRQLQELFAAHGETEATDRAAPDRSTEAARASAAE